MNTIDLQKYINERIKQEGGQMPTMERLNSYIADYNHKLNNQQRGNFEGLSPTEIHSIIHFPFSDASPVQYNKLTSEENNLCPLFRQAKVFIKHIEQEGELKLTAVGNIPPRIVKEMYPLGIGDYFIEAGIGKLTKETDSECVHLARILVELSGIVKKRNNKLSLTATGKKIIKDDHSLFWKLFTTHFDKFNWGYFDGYEMENLGKFAYPYSFVLIAKYGSEHRLEEFYGEKFFEAFPSLVEQLGKNTILRNKSESVICCYCSRVFRRFFNYWGLITRSEELKSSNRWVEKTEFFDKLIKILPHRELEITHPKKELNL